MTPEDSPAELPSQPKPSKEPLTKLFHSEDLFKGDKIVCIDHEGAIYRLQITSRGKLILQK